MRPRRSQTSPPRRGPSRAWRRRSRCPTSSQRLRAACASRATSGEISAVAADTISPVWIPTPRRTSKPSTPGGRATSSSAAATARTASSSCTCGCPNTATTSMPSSASTVAPRAASVARTFSTIFGTVVGIASGSGDDPSARLIDTSTARTLTILRVGSPATGGSGGGSDRPRCSGRGRSRGPTRGWRSRARPARARVEAELLAEAGAPRVERFDRLGLPAGPIKREHQVRA